VQDVDEQHRVERARREREPVGRGTHHRQAGPAAPQAGEHRRRDVDADDVHTGIGERNRDAAGPDAHLEQRGWPYGARELRRDRGSHRRAHLGRDRPALVVAVRDAIEARHRAARARASSNAASARARPSSRPISGGG
jgi:hypothetical protein